MNLESSEEREMNQGESAMKTSEAAAASAEQGVNKDDGSQRPSVTSSQSGSHISFGEVRVHKHRMTLGDNPSADGVPVELAWDVDESEILSVDKFEKEHPTHEVHRIAKKSREKIAQESHSRQSITRVEHEVEKIQKSREASERDEDRKLGSQLKAPLKALSGFWRK